MVIASWVATPKGLVGDTVKTRLASLRAIRARLEAELVRVGETRPWVARVVIQHWLLRVRAEIRWHQELASDIGSGSG
jgi:hypothetical protein